MVTDLEPFSPTGGRFGGECRRRKDPYKMDKEEILTEITKLKEETEALHKFLESSHKKYITDLMLVDMIKERERTGA